MTDRTEKRPSRGMRVIRWVVIFSTLILLGAVAAYPISNWMREPMNEASRAKLLGERKAKQFVQTSLSTMHVRVSGPEDGPILLLIHGGIVGGYVFEKWQQPLADAGYRVIVPDLLGQGYSDHPSVPYTKEFYVRQLNELLDGLKVTKPVNVIGASLGGGIAIAFAGRDPSRVKSISLVAPEGGGTEGERVNDLLLLPVVGDWVFRVVGPSILRNMMADANDNNPSARRGMVAWMTEQTRYRGYGEGVLNSIRNTLSNHGLSWQPQALDAIGHSAVPTIAIWGTKDTIVPFAHSKELQRRIPQLQLVPLQNEGHAINFGREANLISFILPFLDKANNRKTLEGASHPDRDAQFHYISDQVKAALADDQPAISVDTKKKELVGDFKNNGREYRPKGEKIRVHDFKIPELGRAAPYGVYDIAATTTKAGLTVPSELDTNSHPKDLKVADADMEALNLHRHTFHGEWNYTIKPQTNVMR